MAGKTVLLYAWANPVKHLKGVDHTWVTDYPAPFGCTPGPKNHYWYCWGDCHPTGAGTTARLLCQGKADLDFARCICTPDDPNGHGGIDLYGIDGVCHQVTNQVLYSTSPFGKPLTVEGAHFYLLSYLRFGTYGKNVIKWKERQTRCGEKAMDEPIEELPEEKDLDRGAMYQMLKSKLGEVPKKFFDFQAKFHSEKDELDKLVLDGKLNGAEFAEKTNQLIGKFLSEMGEVIGEEQCKEIFGAVPGEPVQIVDPKIAAQTHYTQRAQTLQFKKPFDFSSDKNTGIA